MPTVRTISHSQPAPAAQSPTPMLDRAVAPAPSRRSLPPRFWKRTFVAAPIAVGLTLLVRLLAAPVVTILPGFMPLQLLRIGAFTAIGLHAAAGVLALCYRYAAHPIRAYQRIAVAVLLASLVPDFVLGVKHVPGATPAAVALLVLLHLVAGGVGVWFLPALAEGRGSLARGTLPAGALPAGALPGAAPFKDGASSFGTFYPKHYVLAVYPDDASADRAADALRAAGFAADDVVDAHGAALVAYEDAADARKGVLARVGEQWARLYTDATATSRRLRATAAHGAAFVFAYAPKDGQATRAADVLRPLGPNSLHYYGTFTVTRLS